MPAPRLQAEVPVLVFPGALPVESLPAHSARIRLQRLPALPLLR